MNAAWKYLKKILEIISSISVVIVGGSILIQIFFRFFLSRSLTWSEELAQIFLIVLVFIGLVLVEENDEHLQIEILFSVFPKFERGMKSLGKILSSIFAIVIMFSAFNILPATKFIKAKASGLPIKYVYYSMFLGALAWLIQCIINFIKLNKGGREI